MHRSVLHVLPHRGGGAETYIDFLERIPGFSHKRLALAEPGGGASKTIGALSHLPTLRRRAVDFDIVHAHGDTAAALAVPVTGRRSAIVVTTHGLHRLRRMAGPGRAAALRLLSRPLSRVMVTICTSQSEHTELAALFSPGAAERLETIPNGVEIPAANAAARDRARAALGFDDDDVVVLQLGELDPRKDPILSAEAVASARARGLPVTLLLAGDGPLAGALERLNDPGVRLLGHVDDPSGVLQAADIFLQPSWREGMAYALLEAMAHGLPVIASEIPANAEALSGAGVLIAPGDRTAWADEVANLAADANARERLGTAARERIRASFELERFLVQTQAAYARALAGRGQGA